MYIQNNDIRRKTVTLCAIIPEISGRIKIHTNDTKDDTKDDTKELSDRQQIIIELIRKNPSVTIQEMTQKTNASESTIKRELAYLAKVDVIVRKGSRKEGHWEVIPSEKKD